MTLSQQFSHLGEDGSVNMVDVSGKPLSRRIAIAEAFISLRPETRQKIEENQLAKGNVFAVAQVAAIQAVKRAAELIPLCHSLPVQYSEVGFETLRDGVRIECRVVTVAQTGVEMEALTGAAVAALTIYDMCKAVDKSMIINSLRLVTKTKEPL